MLSAIAKPFGWLMLFLYNFVNDYGLALILFALVVRLILLPFSMKSKKSLMRTTRLQPIMKELEKRYEGNKQKYQEEVAKLYKEEKINPMSGCFWSLIPFPILIALYQAIRFPITIMMGVGEEAYTTIQAKLAELGYVAAEGSASVAYGQIAESRFITEHFAAFEGLSEKLQTLSYNWIGLDLGNTPTFRFWEFGSSEEGMWAQIGLFLIPIVSALLSYLQMIISNKMNGTDMAAEGTGKTMMYMMPLISLWIGYSMPGALGLYWIASSFFSIIQDAVLNVHYKKIMDAEDAERRERMAAAEAERAAKRAETEKLRAANATVTNPNTSKRKLAMQQKQKTEEKDLEWEAAQLEKKRIAAGKPARADQKKANPSAVGDRPYARGRNYKPDRFNKNYVPTPEDEEPILVEEVTEVTEATEVAPEVAAESLPTAAESIEIIKSIGSEEIGSGEAEIASQEIGSTENAAPETGE